MPVLKIRNPSRPIKYPLAGQITCGVVAINFSEIKYTQAKNRWQYSKYFVKGKMKKTVVVNFICFVFYFIRNKRHILCSNAQFYFTPFFRRQLGQGVYNIMDVDAASMPIWICYQV
jgi:hypothetical protein